MRGEGGQWLWTGEWRGKARSWWPSRRGGDGDEAAALTAAAVEEDEELFPAPWNSLCPEEEASGAGERPRGNISGNRSGDPGMKDDHGLATACAKGQWEAGFVKG